MTDWTIKTSLEKLTARKIRRICDQQLKSLSYLGLVTNDIEN